MTLPEMQGCIMGTNASGVTKAEAASNLRVSFSNSLPETSACLQGGGDKEEGEKRKMEPMPRAVLLRLAQCIQRMRAKAKPGQELWQVCTVHGAFITIVSRQNTT